MYPKLYVTFHKFTPPTQGLYMIQPKQFYTFYIRRCPICFLQNISQIGLVVLEKNSFERFLPSMVMTVILNRIIIILAIFRSPKPWRLYMKFGYILPSGFREELFESVDGRRTDDGGCQSYKLSRSLRLRGAKTNIQ